MILALGEGWHNNRWRHPGSKRIGLVSDTPPPPGQVFDESTRPAQAQNRLTVRDRTWRHTTPPGAAPSPLAPDPGLPLGRWTTRYRSVVGTIRRAVLIPTGLACALLTACGDTVSMGPEAFDPDRFQIMMVDRPWETIRGIATSTSPSAGIDIRVEFAVDRVRRMAWSKGEVTADGEREIAVEAILIGNRAYLRGETLRESTGWITADRSEDFGPLHVVAMAAADPFGAAHLARRWAAFSVVKCGTARTCFVLRADVAPDDRLLVDTESYLPVGFTSNRARGRTLIEASVAWNADVRVDPPPAAREVGAEAFATAHAALLFDAIP